MGLEMEQVLRLFFNVLFTAAGVLHFVEPVSDMLVKMIPPFYPGPPLAWVRGVGVVEVLGGLALLTPRYQAAARFLAVLLVALTQAHVYCQMNDVVLVDDKPMTASFWRLRNGVQFVWLLLLLRLAAWDGDAPKAKKKKKKGLAEALEETVAKGPAPPVAPTAAGAAAAGGKKAD